MGSVLVVDEEDDAVDGLDDPVEMRRLRIGRNHGEELAAIRCEDGLQLAQKRDEMLLILCGDLLEVHHDAFEIALREIVLEIADEARAGLRRFEHARGGFAMPGAVARVVVVDDRHDFQLGRVDREPRIDVLLLALVVELDVTLVAGEVEPLGHEPVELLHRSPE